VSQKKDAKDVFNVLKILSAESLNFLSKSYLRKIKEEKYPS